LKKGLGDAPIALGRLLVHRDDRCQADAVLTRTDAVAIAVGKPWKRWAAQRRSAWTPSAPTTAPANARR